MLLGAYIQVSSLLTSLRQGVADRASRAYHREDGIETIEWVLIAVAVAVVMFAIYKILGTTASDFVCSKIIKGIDSSAGC